MTKQKQLSPDVGRQMDGATAKKWVENWRNASDEEKIKAGVLQRKYEYSGCDCYSEMFAIEGCVGTVLFDALDDDGQHHFVRYPVDAAGKILNLIEGGKDGDDPTGWQFTYECPPVCEPPIGLP